MYGIAGKVGEAFVEGVSTGVLDRGIVAIVWDSVMRCYVVVAVNRARS